MRHIRTIITITVAVLAFGTDRVDSFQLVRTQLQSSQAIRSFALFGKKSSESVCRKDQQEGEDFVFGSGNDLNYAENVASDDEISSSLNRKLKELELGIGKRYITRTQRGFLNVHYEVRGYFAMEQRPCWIFLLPILYPKSTAH